MNVSGQKRVIVVLGMHRSGTSAITRALVAIGAGVGENLLPAGSDNPRGFWEDRDFVAFNDRLLALLHAAYDSLAMLPAGWESRAEIASLRLEAALMVREKLAHSDVFALKDPRTCRLLPFWQAVFAHLGLRVDYVVAVRNPLSVAKSLEVRNQFLPRKSLWLWLQHYVGAVCGTSGLSRVFVDYDQLLAEPERELRRLSTALELHGDEAGLREYVDDFLSHDLRHAGFVAEDLKLAPGMPSQVCEAYGLLQAAVTEPFIPADGFAEAWEALATGLDRQGAMLDFLHEYDLLVCERQLQLAAAATELERVHRAGEGEIERLNQLLVVADVENRRLNQQLEQQLEMEREQAMRRQQLEEALSRQEFEHETRVQEFLRFKQASEQELLVCRGELERVSQTLHELYASHSLRVTAPLRWISSFLRHKARAVRRLAGHALRNPASLGKGARYLRAHGLAGTWARVREIGRGSPELCALPEARFELRRHGHACVLTTPHCLFVAESIVRQLSRVGVDCEIIFKKPARGFRDVPHFVICPQMFAELPGLYVAFQMEQTVSSRWLTAEYLSKLEHSFAIFDYSLDNLEYFSGQGLSERQLYFMPIGWLADYHALPAEAAAAKEYDVLFYGDINNERRKQFIEVIEQRHRVKVISNLFGEELYRELRKARLVINVHYYEGALLETTRLYECLSLGCMIVSEESVDMTRHQELQGIIDFVEIGDADGMLERLDYWLEDDARREQRLAENEQKLRRQPNWFEYYFQRFLLASENIDFETFCELAGSNVRFAGNFLCLGLPESSARRLSFERDNAYGIEYVPGLRYPLGWVGCGMSYKFIMRRAAEQELPFVIVCEDDVEFLPGWSERLGKVLDYLQDHADDWDVFSGFIADLHQHARVTGLVERDGLELVHIDRMVSAVLNVYNASFYQAIQKWNENNHDVHGNTIDRYMENHAGIRVVTLHPFLVGHKEEQKSTLWGFDNSNYNEMIVRSMAALEAKIEDYRRECVD